MKKCVFALACLLVASVASAQTPVRNPTTAVFTTSPDHAVITRYELGWFIGTATSPVQVADLGTGTPTNNEVSKPLPSYPVGTVYTAKIKAYAGTLESDWSSASNPFYRAPAPPPSLVIR